MLLGNLSSCCNPWIYMGFNSRLWPRPLRPLACCGDPRPPRRGRRLSNGSLSSWRTTRFGGAPTLSLSLSLRGRPGPPEALKDSEQEDGEGITETGVF